MCWGCRMTQRRTVYLYPDDMERLKVLKSWYGLGTSAACRAGLALLLAYLREEDRQRALDTTVGPIRREEKEMDWSKRRNISKDELVALEAEAVSITTTIHSTLGTYDAIFTMADGTDYRVTTEALNPVGDVSIKQIDAETAKHLMYD